MNKSFEKFLSATVALPVAISKPANPVASQEALLSRIGVTGNAQPHKRLDWALWWARRGMAVFPCEEFLGTPLESKWYRTASSERDSVVAWWTATPDADIAAVPERSGHFVIRARGPQGRVSFFDLTDDYELAPDFFYVTRWGDLHAWLKGEVFSSQDQLGPGLDVIGPGRFVYLPPSAAPDAI